MEGRHVVSALAQLLRDKQSRTTEQGLLEIWFEINLSIVILVECTDPSFTARSHNPGG